MFRWLTAMPFTRASRQGNIPAVASAYDLAGNYAEDVQIIPVTVDGNATADPSVAITAPTDEEEILGLVDVIGTADDIDLAYYTLSYRADGESDFVEYHRSDVAVNNGVLGPFDGTLLENGLYTLLLTAVDIYGSTTSDSVQIYVSGEQKLGNFTLSFNDMSLNLSGIDIEVVRTYDSRVRTRRDFGVGWSLAVKQSANLSENVGAGSWMGNILHRLYLGPLHGMGSTKQPGPRCHNRDTRRTQTGISCLRCHHICRSHWHSPRAHSI